MFKAKNFILTEQEKNPLSYSLQDIRSEQIIALFFISIFCPCSWSKYSMNWSLRPRYFPHPSNKEPTQKGKHLLLLTTTELLSIMPCLWQAGSGRGRRAGIAEDTKAGGHKGLLIGTWWEPILPQCKRLIRQFISCHFSLLSVIPSKNKVTLLVYLCIRPVNA